MNEQAATFNGTADHDQASATLPIKPKRKSIERSLIYLEPLILAKPDAAAFISVSESMVDKLVAQKRLKPPRKISSGRAGYLVADLKEFVQGLPVSDLLPPPNSGYGRAGKAGAGT